MLYFSFEYLLEAQIHQLPNLISSEVTLYLPCSQLSVVIYELEVVAGYFRVSRPIVPDGTYGGGVGTQLHVLGIIVYGDFDT